MLWIKYLSTILIWLLIVDNRAFLLIIFVKIVSNKCK